MVLDFQTYRDKVMGCWAGKNIGGVLGAPFECFRQFNENDFYIQDLSMGPPPNDDLDLQIVWLAAVERYGRNVNAQILGDYWLSYVIPNWVEYGMGKANLRAGLVPPMSGAVDNPYKDSCGCYIRSEIWACLAPGQPQLAARYAYEDAIVDHADDGMHGEIFCAALQSAAFVESDPMTLIDIALSYIPRDSKVTACVETAVDSFKKKLTLKEAIAAVHDAAPGTFGVQGITHKEALERTKKMGMKEVGAPGFDAPENVGYVILGWLYGADFGDQIVKANSCGEDTDCTCATLGALLGIILGNGNLPEKWTKPLGDKIATMCIDKTSRGIWVPETCTELTDRVLRATPLFLGQELCDIMAEGGYTIQCKSGDALFCPDTGDYQRLMNGMGKDHSLPIKDLTALSSNVARYQFPSFSAMVDLGESPFYTYGEDRTFKVKVKNEMAMRQQQWCTITLYAPDGVEILGPKKVMLPLNNLWGSEAAVEFAFNADMNEAAKLEMLVDIQLEGRHSSGALKVVLFRAR